MMTNLSSFRFLLFFIFVPLVFSSPMPTDKSTIDIIKRITHVGRGTWFEPGLGNCGYYNYRDQSVLAISLLLYDRNLDSNCGQWVEIVNIKNGKIVYGYTVDSCESCKEDDLDMSPALFQGLDALTTGEINISWHFLPKGPNPIYSTLSESPRPQNHGSGFCTPKNGTNNSTYPCSRPVNSERRSQDSGFLFFSVSSFVLALMTA